MVTFTKGDVILYPFLYTNLENTKLRPCLILSEEIGDDILMCQITSQNISSDKYSITLNKNETLDGTLYIDSYIRTNMLFTGIKINAKKICKLTNSKYNKVCKKIYNLIKL